MLGMTGQCSKCVRPGGPDFSSLTERQRLRVERYVDNLTDDQLDRLAALTPEQSAKLIPAQPDGLGFFWWIIEAAYAVKVAADAKKKKAAAKKKTDEMKAKATEAVKKQKAQLDAVNKELNALDKLQASILPGEPGAPSVLPNLIGILAIGGVILYLIRRKTRNA